MPKKMYLQGILLHYFIQEKSAPEAYRILVETYGNHVLSETTCRDWFWGFKNNDFDVKDKECFGAPKKGWRWRIGDITSWRLMSGTSWTCRIIRSWSCNTFEMFECTRNEWKVEELKARAVKWCLVTCEQLLQQQNKKGFCIISWPEMKSGWTTLNLNIEDRRVSLFMHQYRQQNRTFMVQRFCTAFGGISWV